MFLVKHLLSAIGAGPLDEPPPYRPALATSGNAQEPRRETSTAQIEDDVEKTPTSIPVETGTVAIEASQALWGKKGRWLVIAG